VKVDLNVKSIFSSYRFIATNVAISSTMPENILQVL
jgi:hypothetical protein